MKNQFALCLTFCVFSLIFPHSTSAQLFNYYETQSFDLSSPSSSQGDQTQEDLSDEASADSLTLPSTETQLPFSSESTFTEEQNKLNGTQIEAEKIFNKAIDEFNNNNLQNSITLFNQSIELDPLFKEAYLSRGVAYRKLGNNTAAIDDYSRAIELDPQYSAAYLNRGVAKSRLADYKGALEDYSKAIKFQPNYLAAYLNRANLKIQKKDYKGAIDDLNKAIEIKPNSHKAYFSRGRAYSSVDQYDAAIEDYTKAIFYQNQYPEAFYNRAITKARAKNYDSALQDAETAKSLYEKQANQDGINQSQKLIKYIRDKSEANN